MAFTYNDSDFEALVERVAVLEDAGKPIRLAPLSGPGPANVTPSGLGTWMVNPVTGGKDYVLTADVAIATRRGFTLV